MELRQISACLRPTALLATAAVLIALAGCDAGRQEERREATASPQVLQAWDRIAAVLQHPRCLNCHQVESPLQGDDGHPHIPQVVRGEDNLGIAAMRCGNCHNQMGNNPTSGVPGAPHWSLAPLSMSWAGLSSAELCRALIDPERNGNRGAEELVSHMGEDKLVLWGWQPGAGREPVPLPHGEFMQQLQIWVDAGMPCPRKDAAINTESDADTEDNNA